ncbi:hypothetical protein, partial [Actinomadura roseirufa]|uniref:hypothetical protein n=1 Tax=Actinomadura roseirufa TaxID=2094049 RepID=UPI001A955D42
MSANHRDPRTPRGVRDGVRHGLRHGLRHGARRATRASLRARLLAITTALVAAGLAIGSTVMIGVLDRYQTGRVDDRIRATAQALSIRSRESREEGDVPPDPRRIAPVFDILGFSYLVFLRPDGGVARVVYRPGVEGRPGPRLPRLDAAAVRRR